MDPGGYRVTFGRLQGAVGRRAKPEIAPLLLLKYFTLPDATKDLGDIASIRETFTGFQQWLYR